MIKTFIRNMIALLLIIYGCWCLAVKPGFASDNELTSCFHYSNDVDDVEKNEASAGYKKHFHHKQYAGFSIGNTTFIEPGGDDVDFSFINLTGRKNFTDNYYLEGNIRYNSGDTDNITYNFSAVTQKEQFGRIELFTERSMIDSHAALAKELFFTTYGISVDYEINPELMATGVLFWQTATDDNERLGQVAQLAYSPKRFEGFFVKGRGKFRQADFNPPEYFMPDDFKRYDILLGYAHVFFDHFRFKGEAGPGIQYINGIKEKGFEYKLSLHGWITQSLKLELEYASTTDSGDIKYNYDWGKACLRYFW